VSLLSSSIESLIQRFWEIEEPDKAPPTLTEEGTCEGIFVSETYRDSSGQFVVPLPYRTPPTSSMFQGSHQMALSRLERKLVQYERLYTAYKQFMHEYESLVICLWQNQ